MPPTPDIRLRRIERRCGPLSAARTRSKSSKLFRRRSTKKSVAEVKFEACYATSMPREGLDYHIKNGSRPVSVIDPKDRVVHFLNPRVGFGT
jgi:hypothetical protein